MQEFVPEGLIYVFTAAEYDLKQISNLTAVDIQVFVKEMKTS
jgi:hypothetical protein